MATIMEAFNEIERREKMVYSGGNEMQAKSIEHDRAALKPIRANKEIEEIISGLNTFLGRINNANSVVSEMLGELYGPHPEVASDTDECGLPDGKYYQTKHVMRFIDKSITDLQANIEKLRSFA